MRYLGCVAVLAAVFAGQPARAEVVYKTTVQEETDCDRMAAQQGDLANPPAIKGVDIDNIPVPQAFTACEAAIRDFPGEARFQFQLGRIFHKTEKFDDAMSWYRKAADLGYPGAMRNTGLLYEKGEGVAQDYAQALQWYEKAALRGSRDAMTNVGLVYENGFGVAVDLARAMTWYRNAADLGDFYAMNNIGLFYNNGSGVAVDYAEAMRWYKMSAAFDFGYPMYNIGALYDEGKGVVQDPVQALDWYRKAAEADDSYAPFATARLTAKGLGTAANPAEAARLVEDVLRAGDGDAKDDIKAEAKEWPAAFWTAFQKRLADQGLFSPAPDGTPNAATIAAIDTIFGKPAH